MKDAPVSPNNPLHELNDKTSAILWFFSRPIDAVASNIIFAFIFFANFSILLIGKPSPILVSVGHPITQLKFPLNQPEASNLNP